MYLGSSVSSTESDINMRLAKAWTAINRLSIIWKSDLSNKIKCDFFQTAVVSILLDRCTKWKLTKDIGNRNCTRMLQTILNKSWKQHSSKQLLYGHLLPISKTIQIMMKKTCRTLLEKQGWSHEWCSPIDPFTLKCLCWTTSKNLTTTALWGHRM